uniref:Uncharacterized protein n=1 Tax=Homalodisca liturata TaxID=320908 RepID=A0A1B6HTS6_9HEMI
MGPAQHAGALLEQGLRKASACGAGQRSARCKGLVDIAREKQQKDKYRAVALFLDPQKGQRQECREQGQQRVSAALEAGERVEERVRRARNQVLCLAEEDVDQNVHRKQASEKFIAPVERN